MHFLSFHRNIHYWFYNQKIALLLKLEKFLIYILENTESKVKKKKKKKGRKSILAGYRVAKIRHD